MKKHYRLNPDVIFLNHGSFGATPRSVLKAYHEWQARLERQPVQFLGRDIWDELKQARQILGDYLNADADDLVYIPNATFGTNIIARSLQIEPGGEILTTKTRVIFISHITSPTAVQMSVDIICKMAREAGILSIIDGAHVPGQIPLDLTIIELDFYLGNCHKWMQSSKGAGFLYARRELQPLLEPLVVSWGWSENSAFTTGSKYLDCFEWSGTHDPSAYLSVPAAIQFQAEHHWPTIQERCQQILADGLKRVDKLTGLETVYSVQAAPFVQMAVVRLPRVQDISAFQRELLRQYSIEVPCIDWNGQHFIRISIQAYNTEQDIDALVAAVEELIPQHRA